MLHYLAYGAAFVLIALVLALAGAITFGTAEPPPQIDSLKAADIAIRAELDDLPAAESFTARDGEALAYRAYAASPERVVVLIHGSSGSSVAVHGLAKALQQAGISVYAPDIRGHGGSGRNGDIDYVGQLEDDLVDLLGALGPVPGGGKRILVGHSSGGGFVLRFAGGQFGDRFDGYALLAPYLHHSAPTVRPNAGGWAAPYIPRIIGLSILSQLGVHWFNGLPVIAFGVPPEEVNASRTPFYSYRLWANFAPHNDWQSDILNIGQPARVVVGAEDELFRAKEFAPTFGALRPDIPVVLVPDASHMELVTAPNGHAAAIAAFEALAASEKAAA